VTKEGARGNVNVYQLPGPVYGGIGPSQMGSERLHGLVFVGPPDGQLSLSHVHHDVPRWEITTKPVTARLGGRFAPPVHNREGLAKAHTALA
jgi:hypothetical protein